MQPLLPLDAGSVQLRIPDQRKGGALSARTKISGRCHNSRSLVTRTLTHTRAFVARIREAPDIGDLEARVLLNLYKIAHYEVATVYSSKPALSLLRIVLLEVLVL